MTFNQLRTFLAVAETRALRAAARLLNVSQPAVSKTIRDLERHLGGALFERHSSGVILTECGRAFRPRASLLIKEMRRAQEETNAILAGTDTSVSIAVSSTLALSILPVAYERFRKAMPGSRIHIFEGVMPMALEQLRDGSVDFVATHALSGMVSDEFHEHHLFTTPLAVCAREGHPLAQARHLEQLLDAQWLSPGYSLEKDYVLHRVFAQHGLAPPTNPLWCQSFTVGLGLLSQADLLAMIAKPLVLSTLKAQGIIALPIQESMPSVSGVVITRKGDVLTRSAQQFFDCMEVATRKYLASAPDCFLPYVPKDDRRAVRR